METKITKFADIKLLTRVGNWECDFGLEEVLRFIDDRSNDDLYKMDLDPDFQRGHVWDASKQIKWLEFIMRGGQTSRVIYFNHPGWQNDYKGTMVLVDGKQRIESLRRFFNNEIKVFGSYYKEFTDTTRMIHNTMKINVNNLKTRAEVLQWYIDFNAGGVYHTVEEIGRVQALLDEENSKI